MQSFLNGLRTQAGMGAGVASPPYMRSAAQNNTQSGNPGYASNMTGYGSVAPQQAPPMTWQQQMQQTMQQRSALAQDPTAIQYMVPQPANNMMQATNGANGRGGMPPINYNAPVPNGQSQLGGVGSMPPVAFNNGQLTPQQQMMALAQGQQNNGMFAGLGGMFANPNGQPSTFVQPRPVAPALGGAPGQPNLTAGYGGGAGNSRFVRPMQR